MSRLIQCFGGHRDGDWILAPQDGIAQKRCGRTKDELAAYATYVEHEGRMVFIGYLEFGHEAIEVVCRHIGIRREAR
jgi:hypothetical protein